MASPSTLARILVVSLLSALPAMPLASAQTLPPTNLNVNCNVGGSVMRTLNGLAAILPQPIVLHISGVCTEAVTITRNDVTLQGNSTSDGLQAPSANATVLTLNGSLRTTLNQLMVTGGNQGIFAENGASFIATGILVTGAQATPVSVNANSNGALQNSTVQNATQEALHVVNGGTLVVSGGTVQNSVSFASQVHGGHLWLSGGVIIQNAGFQGLSVDGSGSIEIDGATIEGVPNNNCIFAFTGGTVRIIGSSNLIRNCGTGLAVDGGRAEMSGGIVTTSGGGISVSNGGSSSSPQRSYGAEQHRQRHHGLRRLVDRTRQCHRPGQRPRWHSTSGHQRSHLLIV